MMTYEIIPREEPINDVAAADLWEDGLCRGVLVVCDAGVKKITEGGYYPSDICRYGTIKDIRMQDIKLMAYCED